MKKILLASLIILLCIGLAGCSESPFRLHILANSNSQEDQNVKLKVRDAVLELTKDGMLECKTKEDAEKYMREHLDEITKTADEVLQQENFDYKAEAVIGKFDFPDKKYGDVVYPAGEYDALRIVLGEGEGDNWWCVMFPPLCIVNMEEKPEEPVEYDSAILEWFEQIFGTQQSQQEATA